MDVPHRRQSTRYSTRASAVERDSYLSGLYNNVHSSHTLQKATSLEVQTMSSPQTATERSPLLGRDHRQCQTDDSATTSAATPAPSVVKATDNGSTPNDNANEDDVERRGEPSEEDDPETLRTARSLKYILPVLGVGVRSLGLEQHDCRKADGHRYFWHFWTSRLYLPSMEISVVIYMHWKMFPG